ncbi:MAG: hypothetical protein H6744_07885 [Deltaproteobacteria bacterium]|nr:hypothetical protein [Deltaproteobacteria bacterium]MCB9786600.1 hypothetical protein [Deltaproteobacteria bacterium]
MQDRPDREALLRAVAGFLKSDVVPAVADAGLRFRLLVATHVLGVVERELRGEHADWAAEAERLAGLGLAVDPQLVDEPARRRAVTEAQAALCARIDAAPPEDDLSAERAHVLATLREKLAVVNPRYDLSPTIE